MKILYYDCFAGISGDMNLGAMIDFGVDPGYLREQLELLGLKGYDLVVSTDRRKGISGTRVEVVLNETDKHHRNLKDIKSIIGESGLAAGVKDRSIRMFSLLAEAEAKIHGKSIDQVHFHEVGAIDSIIDIAGAAICLEFLKPERILASPVQLGGGFVNCAHGTFPVPAPATAEILKGIPIRSGAVEFETTTPTGALILACNADGFGSLDGLKIVKTAYGIGHRDLDIPNVLRIFEAEVSEGGVGEEEIFKTVSGTEVSRDESRRAQTGVTPGASRAWLLECNIDDMNPEVYGSVMDTLFELGADDVFITPIIMKKARPASKLSVLCKPDIRQTLEEVLLTHTTSLGVRSSEVSKTMLEREISTLETRFGEVRIKTAVYKGKKLKSKPEYEDCVKLAKKHNIPVQQVYQEISGLLNQK